MGPQARLPSAGLESVTAAGWKKFLRRTLEMQPGEAVARVASALDEFIQTDLSKARRLADAFATAVQRLRDPCLTAWACRLQARTLYGSGRNHSALRKYQQAERIHQKRKETIEAARVQKAQVACLMYLGRYRQALKVAKKARSVFARTGDRRQLAELDNNVGLIFHRLDRNPEAKRYFDLAYQEFREEGDATALAHVEFNRANIAANLNHLDESLALYQRARELYASGGMKLGVAQAKYSIAYNHFLMGDFTAAIGLFEESQQELDAAGDRKWSGLCDLDRAELFLRLNLPERSLASAEKAENIFGELGMTYEAAKARFFAGVACSALGEEEKAARKLDGAARLFAREGNDVYLAVLQLTRGERALESGEPGAAVKLAQLAKRTFVRRGLKEKVCECWLLEVKADIARGRAAAARSRLRAFRRLAPASAGSASGLSSPWLFYRAAHLRAKAAALRGKLSVAAGELDAAIKAVEELRGRIRPDDFRYGFFSDKQEIYFDRVAISLKQGDLARAFELLEQSKARVLADVRIARHSSRPQGKAYERWKSQVAELNWLYQRALGAERKTGRRTHAMRRELALTVAQKESEVAHAWSLAQNELERAGERWDPLMASDVQKRLGEDDLLVEYFVYRDQVSAFLVSRDGLQVRSLGPSASEVARALASFRFQLGRFQYGEEFVLPRLATFRSDTDAALESLHDLLLTPLADELDGRKLVIVPHDFLHELPFHALRNRVSGRYVLEDRPVSYLPSSSLLREIERPGRTGGNGFVVFGYATGQAPQIADETERLSRFLPHARVYSGEDATLASLRQAAPHAAYLHLAAHGIFRRDNPLFSSLRLADGWLHFHEIVDMPLEAELVTLSGCSTGVQRVVGGDELLGMTRGFLYAGIPSLVVSLWMVADRSTADLMEAFYRGLLEGLDKAEALRAAALKVKDSYDHPYFWAPFFLLGRP